jgi:hypothetical protein
MQCNTLFVAHTLVSGSGLRLHICKTANSSVWSGNMDDDEEGRTNSASFRKENI